jgi:hypothetical protein
MDYWGINNVKVQGKMPDQLQYTKISGVKL